jgi:predicted Fe-Mo cluster-binding NifX family protein
MGKVGISVVHHIEGLSAVMDDRFGRAEAFLVVDPDTGEVAGTLINPSKEASHGAGTQAANIMKCAGVDKVISGRFGPKAFETLQALEIEGWMAPSGVTAREALRMLKEGTLERMELQVRR